MENLLLGLIPAVGWGSQSIVMQKIGGRFTNKAFGMVTGAVIFAVIVTLIRQPVNLTLPLIVGSTLSGICWSIGLLMQVYSFDLLGISKAMPISTGEQLIGTVLIGALYFHEWTTVKQFSIGVLAVVLIIVGVVIIALKGRGRANGGNAGQSLAYALGVLTISSFGLIGYAVIPRVFNLNGWDMLLPQSLAMWVSMFLFISVVPGNQIWSAKSWQNIVTGMCFAVANLAILISNQVNGLAIGYTLSQLNVVIATLGGLFILHEHHGKNGRLRISVGLTLVIAGAIFIGTTR